MKMMDIRKIGPNGKRNHYYNFRLALVYSIFVLSV